AALPGLAYLRYRVGSDAGIAVNLFERSRMAFRSGRQAGVLEQATEFPRSGYSRLTVRCAAPTRLGLRGRIPGWAGAFEVRPPGSCSFAPVAHAPGAGWYELPAREWRDGETLEVRMELSPRLVTGDPANAGRAAWTWGPLALALDERAAGGPEA